MHKISGSLAQTACVDWKGCQPFSTGSCGRGAKRSKLNYNSFSEGEGERIRDKSVPNDTSVLRNRYESEEFVSDLQHTFQNIHFSIHFSLSQDIEAEDVKCIMLKRFVPNIIFTSSMLGLSIVKLSVS